MRYVMNDEVLVLPLTQECVRLLMLGVGLIPASPQSVALLNEIKQQAFPPGSDADAWTAMEKKLREELRQYARYIRDKYGVKPSDARPKARPTLLGHQYSTGNRVMWVSAVGEGGVFSYTPSRAAAHVFPSRNAAHTAVRRRMQAVRELMAHASPAAVDRACGKFTDFFTEPLFDGARRGA